MSRPRRCPICNDVIDFATEEVAWYDTSVPTGNRYGRSGRKTVRKAMHAESVDCRNRYKVREEILLSEIAATFATYGDNVPNAVYTAFFGTRDGTTVEVDEANGVLIRTRPMTGDERAAARAAREENR